MAMMQSASISEKNATMCRTAMQKENLYYTTNT